MLFDVNDPQPNVAAPTILTPTGAAFTSGAVAFPVANTAYFTRLYVPIRGTYRYSLAVIGVASGNVQFGLARLSGAGLLNYALAMDTTVIACPVAGDMRIDLGATDLAAGPYGAFWWADNTTVTGPISNAVASRTAARSFAAVAGLVAGVPASGSVAAWNADRGVSWTLEADV